MDINNFNSEQIKVLAEEMSKTVWFLMMICQSMIYFFHRL